MADDFGGFLGGLQRGMMNPMTLGGIGLLSGKGMDGLTQGLKAGADQQNHAHQLSERERRDGFMQGIDPNNPIYKGINPALLDLARGVGGDFGSQALTKGLLGKADNEHQMQLYKMQHGFQSGLERQKMEYAKQLEMQQLQNKMKMIQDLQGGGAPAAPAAPNYSGAKRYNPATGELE